MVWDDTYPDGSIIEANTLHTVLQNVKILLRERAQANNGNFDEHSFFGESADGTHDLSRVGFVKVWTVLEDIIGEIGTIHYLNSNDTDEGFYVITNNGAIKITTPYHANLDGLEDDDHTQILLEDGSRSMQTTLYCSSGNLTINDYITGDSSPLSKSGHNDLSWYDAHGAGCIVGRHIRDSGISLTYLNDNSPLTGPFMKFFSCRDSGSDYVISFDVSENSLSLDDDYRCIGFPEMAISVDPNNGGAFSLVYAGSGAPITEYIVLGMTFTSKAGSSCSTSGCLIRNVSELNE